VCAWGVPGCCTLQHLLTLPGLRPRTCYLRRTFQPDSGLFVARSGGPSASMGVGGAGDEALVPAVAQHKLSQADPGLAAVVSMGMTHHVVGKTRSGYKSARSAYLRFCADRGLEPWPVSDVVLAAWLHFIVVTVAVSSMGVYMAGLAYYQGLMGLPWRLLGSEVVRRTLRYLKRRFPEAGCKLKAPITVALLRVLLPLLEGWPILEEMSHDDRTFATASVLAVAGFLRGGEFLSSSSSDRKVLMYADICIKQQGGSWAVGIAIPQPKAMFWLESQEVLCLTLLQRWVWMIRSAL
jgi:hypothetical protein